MAEKSRESRRANLSGDRRHASFTIPIPTEQQKTPQHPALTKDLKANVFSLNAAKLFKVDVEAKRRDVPKDYLSQIEMAYREDGPSPSHHDYGLISV
jgi:uncharacterized protein